MKTNIFISARHGAYNMSDQLSYTGQEQMILLAQKALPFIEGKSTYIISSSAPRAVESAYAFANEIAYKGKVRRMDYFWAASDSPKGKSYYWERNEERLKEFVDLIKQVKEEVIIIFSHKGIAEKIMEMAKGPKSMWPQQLAFGYGEGALLDFENNELHKLP